MTYKLHRRSICTIACILAGSASAQAQVGQDIQAISFTNESNSGNEYVIRKMTPENKVGYIDNGSWISFPGFNFGTGVSRIAISASSGNSGGTIEARLGSASGRLIASIPVSNTGGWDNFTTLRKPIGARVSGINDLYFVFVGNGGGLLDIRSFKFENTGGAKIIEAEVNNTSNRYSFGSGAGISFLAADFNDNEYAQINSITWNNVELNKGPQDFVCNVKIHPGRTGTARIGFEGFGTFESTPAYTTSLNNFHEVTLAANIPFTGSYLMEFYRQRNGITSQGLDLDYIFIPESGVDVGQTIEAATYHFESQPYDDNIIRDMGTKVGYMKAANAAEYMGYNHLDLRGAKNLTVRASSGAQGGRLLVKMGPANNPTAATTIATLTVSNTGGWDSFQDFNVPVNEDVISQMHGQSLYFVIDDSSNTFLYDIQSFQFNKAPFYGADVDKDINPNTYTTKNTGGSASYGIYHFKDPGYSQYDRGFISYGGVDVRNAKSVTVSYKKWASGSLHVEPTLGGRSLGSTQINTAFGVTSTVTIPLSYGAERPDYGMAPKGFSLVIKDGELTDFDIYNIKFNKN